MESSRTNETTWGELAGLLTQVAFAVYTEVSEQADLRSWLTLPRNLQVLEVSLPAGSHDLALSIRSQAGAALNTLSLGAVEVVEGRRTFISARSIGPNIFANMGTRGAER